MWAWPPSWLGSLCTPGCHQLFTLPFLHTCCSSPHPPHSISTPAVCPLTSLLNSMCFEFVVLRFCALTWIFLLPQDHCSPLDNSTCSHSLYVAPVYPSILLSLWISYSPAIISPVLNKPSLTALTSPCPAFWVHLCVCNIWKQREELVWFCLEKLTRSFLFLF